VRSPPTQRACSGDPGSREAPGGRVAAQNRGKLQRDFVSTDALPTPTSDASEVAPEKRGFAKHRRAAADAATDDALFRVLAPVAARVPTEMARPAVPAKMRHHQRLQGHALRRCSAGVERDCRRSVLWTPPATQTCTVVHV
jgi:IS5 family transposase